jgi:hypothetical protein
LVTLAPLARALVVQKDPCANALGASTRTAIKDNDVNTSSLLTSSPLQLPLVVDHQPKRNQR